MPVRSALGRRNWYLTTPSSGKVLPPSAATWTPHAAALPGVESHFCVPHELCTHAPLVHVSSVVSLAQRVSLSTQIFGLTHPAVSPVAVQAQPVGQVSSTTFGASKGLSGMTQDWTVLASLHLPPT